MYFNAQRARIPGLETTSHGWVSTYTLSQKAGRVNRCKMCHSKVSQNWGPLHSELAQFGGLIWPTLSH